MPTLTRRDALVALSGTAMLPFVTSCRPAPPAADAPVANPGAESPPLHYLGLVEIGRLIETREISPVELTEVMLDRIEAVDGRLKSYATVMADSALAAARAAEDEIGRGHYRGPLHGVPIAVKDLCYTQGVRTMGGLAVLADFVPSHDATVVSKLAAAGAVLLGKLNLTEGAMGGYHPDFDIPRNPWNEEFWPGGSSSGSGVATAAGLCFGSLGSDTGGSIRLPAMANGIVGLKPTYGRVSRYGVIALAESLDHVGPMTRRVADAAIMLEAIAGEDPNDPTSLNEPVPRVLDALEGGVEGVRLGVDRHYITEGTHAGLVAAIEEALAVLEQLGAHLVDVEVPDTAEIVPALMTLLRSEALLAHAATYPARAEDYGSYFRNLLEIATEITDEQLAEAQAIRTDFSQRFETMVSRVDALVCPSGGVAYRLTDESQDDSSPGSGLERIQPGFTFPANLAGTPTITLPCGFSDEGIPYGMQFVGRDLSEAMLCRIAHAYEQATDWHRRHPDV